MKTKKDKLLIILSNTFLDNILKLFSWLLLISKTHSLLAFSNSKYLLNFRELMNISSIGKNFNENNLNKDEIALNINLLIERILWKKFFLKYFSLLLRPFSITKECIIWYLTKKFIYLLISN